MNRLFTAIFLTSCFAFAGNQVVFGEEFAGRVISVTDGDTITVLVNGNSRKVRLSGIDCPEKSQAFGQQAKAFTSKTAYSRNVVVISQGKDRYKRTIGEVILPDGQNLNNLLLQNGFAWWYHQFSHDKQKQSLEIDARNSRLGLWSHVGPSAPWEYRKQRKAQL